jgi:peptidoglycan/xylan/chitin deacetylase (PgdA/CDA1 family)
MYRITLTRILALKLLAVALWLAGLAWPWALALFLIGDLWIFWNLFIPGASGLVPVVTHFATDQPEVWLTIDDGPDPQDTPRLLDLLDQHGARATFFFIGAKAETHPGLVAEVIRRGHEIGHHTQTHPSGTFWHASPRRVRRELDLGLASFGPYRPQRFRAPVGIKNLFLARALAQRGLRCIAWQVRSRDSFARNSDQVLSRVMSRVHPGAIVLLHEGPKLHPRVRVIAITRILETLTARGWRCVIPTDGQLR